MISIEAGDASFSTVQDDSIASAEELSHLLAAHDSRKSLIQNLIQIGFKSIKI